MANVKFYRLGLTTAVTKAQYDDAKVADDGRIIFARVLDEFDPEHIVNYYIWANGIEYKVADDSQFDDLVERVDQLELDVSTLTDDSSTDGMYDNPDSIHYWIQQAIIEAGLTAEKVYAVIDASNKTYDSSASVREIIAKSADGIDVSIKSGGNNGVDSLMFGVDLDKIYLPHGVQRTEAIGVFNASDNIITDGVGMSVKELLEFWLVKEKFPTTTTSKGSGNFPAYTMTVSGLPKSGNSFKDYVTVNNTALSTSTGQLVEIGSSLKFATVSGTLTYTTTNTVSSKESSPASKVDGMSFGYCTELGNPIVGDKGHYAPAGTISVNLPADSSITASKGTASATYTINNGRDYINVHATLSITRAGSTSSVTVDGSSNYSVDASTVEVVEGSNIVKLSLSHDASITSTYSNLAIPGIEKVYVISNKGHVAPDVSVGVSAGLIGTASGTVNKYTTSQVSVIGVYPIFSNCAFISSNTSPSVQPPQLKDTSTGWHDNSAGDTSTKFQLLNYLASNKDCVITIGESHEGSSVPNVAPAYIYVPKGMTFKVDLMATYNTDANKTFAGWSDNTLGRKVWTLEGSTNIEIQGKNVEYDIYKNNTTAGKCAFILTINKKS